MTSTATRCHAAPSTDPSVGERPGPLGRLGVWVTAHARLTTVVWLLVIIDRGAFAPKVESELSGAGWQADGSESVVARELAQEHFGGNASTAIQVVVHSIKGPVPQGQGKRVPLPVLLQLTGRAAWWTPSWLTRVLPNIGFSHN